MKKTINYRDLSRILLGAFLTFAGTSHLTFAREDFQAQVPDWVPLDKDLTVLLSGGVEISLGMALMLWAKQKKLTSMTVALFFAAVFPGNISQYTHHRDAFGLNTVVFSTGTDSMGVICSRYRSEITQIVQVT